MDFQQKSVGDNDKFMELLNKQKKKTVDKQREKKQLYIITLFLYINMFYLTPMILTTKQLYRGTTKSIICVADRPQCEPKMVGVFVLI